MVGPPSLIQPVKKNHHKACRIVTGRPTPPTPKVLCNILTRYVPYEESNPGRYPAQGLGREDLMRASVIFLSPHAPEVTQSSPGVAPTAEPVSPEVPQTRPEVAPTAEQVSPCEKREREGGVESETKRKRNE